MDGGELESLIAKHIDGTATAEETALLGQLVRSDERCARALARAAIIDADLRQVHRSASMTQAVSGNSISERIASTQRGANQRSPRLRSWRVARPRRAWLVAATLFVAIGGMFLILRADAGAPFSQGGTPVAAGAPLVGTVAITGGGTARITPGSLATAEGTASAPRLRLDRGSVSCEVDPRGSLPPFTLATGLAEVRVIGTGFNVTVDDQLRVAVDRGVVEVVSPEGAVRVGPDSSAIVVRGQPPSLFQPIVSAADMTSAGVWDQSDTSAVIADAGIGPTGAPAKLLRLGVKSYAGTYYPRNQPDWSKATGISLVLRGRGDGTPWRLELLDKNAYYPEKKIENYERFVVDVTDTSNQWREVRIPFSRFTRRLDFYRSNQSNDGLTRRRVHGVAFLSGDRPLTVEIERVGVYHDP